MFSIGDGVVEGVGEPGWGVHWQGDRGAELGVITFHHPREGSWMNDIIL